MEWDMGKQSGHMASYLFLSIFRFVRLLVSGHQAVAFENAALRLQLAAFQRKHRRAVLTAFDRVFWITLRRCGLAGVGRWPMFQADTFVAGSGNGFSGSGPGYRGRSAVGEGGPVRLQGFAN
jgi:hypothetical protein